ncbi:sensor histidine kinase [Tabrizicola sp. WMC-M-20]|nr:sensor histidine kinase [Tabrizicola sp. WMC-M-20]
MDSSVQRCCRREKGLSEGGFMQRVHQTISAHHSQQNWRKRLDVAVLDYCAKQKVRPQEAVDTVSDFLRNGPVLRQRLTDSEQRHRTKNEMQFLISSMRHRRRVRGADEKANCDACIAQVLALAHLNDTLVVDEKRKCIDLAAHFVSLANATRDALGFDENIRVEAEAEAVLVTPNVARNTLLILNEAFTNAMTHAFGDSGGTVRIKLTPTSAGEAELVITDDGCASAPSGGGGSGISLMDALASQIDGCIHRARVIPPESKGLHK